MAESTVTAEQLAGYLRRKGKTGERTLSLLGYYRPFVDAINTEVGKEILKDAIRVHEELLSKIAEINATDAEKAEYQAIRKIILRWSERIAQYEKHLSEVRKG